ncbi:extensin-like [Homarus americanus]|uniref:extensin-like n=1 Tax=Homarus americanus TaxID=6706 RepID=UPI001C46711E|nr:extensin-like [Homarus americanus]
MALLGVWLLSALTLLYLGVPKVQGGKIFFPDSPEAEGLSATPSDTREERGLWESDLFFLQKLSGLFGSDDKPQRRKATTRPNLRPELLPPQFLYHNRRTGTKNPGHLNQVGVRQVTRVPVRSPPHLPSPHQGFQVFGRPLPNPQGLKPPPPRQNVHVITPSTQNVPPPPDSLSQYSHNQQVAFRPPPPLPVPPKLPASVSPVQSPVSFPYQFVRPGTHLPDNNNIPHRPTANFPPRVNAPQPNLPPRPISLPANFQTRVTVPPRHNSPHSPAPRPPPPAKPVKSKKPTLLGSWADFSNGVFGNTGRPQKHPRPAPQPQRVIIPPHHKLTQKKDFKPSLEFKPSPQEGNSAFDAFQPVFVASPFMDDLSDDVMKPMRVAALRTPATTTTSQPILQDFF